MHIIDGVVDFAAVEVALTALRNPQSADHIRMAAPEAIWHPGCMGPGRSGDQDRCALSGPATAEFSRGAEGI